MGLHQQVVQGDDLAPVRGSGVWGLGMYGRDRRLERVGSDAT
jgi:hypothetical protein